MIYDIDYSVQGPLTLPPKKRLPKWIAWVASLLKPLQWARDLFFDTYIGGAQYGLLDQLQYYIIGDRVVWLDNSVYECMNPVAELGSVSDPITDPTNWLKIQDVFIGVDERKKYNSQIIVFEFALNRWFRNELAIDQIYISTNTTTGDWLLMGEDSDYSSYISDQSVFAVCYMGNVYTPSAQNDFTIFVPAALMATLGSTLPDQENAIRAIADKYNTAGMVYNVDTY